MAAINFPSSPTQGQSYSENGQTWYYDGVKWVSGGTFGQSALTPMYQEGTGTPYFVNITNAYADAISSYQSQTMSWARVGNLVSFNLYCEVGATWSQTNGAAPGNYVGINGLPYHMVAGPSSGYPSCTIGYWNEMNWSLLHQDVFSGGNPTAYLGSDTLGPTIGLAYPTYASSGQDVSRIIFSDSVWKANSAIQISGQYITDDTTWVPVDGAIVS